MYCPPGSLLPQCIKGVRSVFGATTDANDTKNTTDSSKDSTEKDGEKEEEAPKATLMDYVLLFLTIYCMIISWSLNNNANIRATLGFKSPAGMVTSILSLLAILVFGPILYLIAIMTPLMNIPFKTNNGKLWLEGIKETRDTSSTLSIAKMLPVIGGGKKAVPAPVEFGRYSRYAHAF